MSERPNCVNCGKALGKTIRRVSVPFDRTDVLEYVRSMHPEKTAVILMDKVEKLNARQVEECKDYERAEQYYARNQADTENRQAATFHYWPRKQKPLPSQYTIEVRVWFGKYGYDGQGVFHGGECAKRWGTAVALELRSKGKV
jgi:hypothetical protein